MTTTTHDGAESAERRAHIEASLAHYPDLAPESLEELLHWFRKEASSLDVALVASNQDIAVPYARFRADHIDPLRGSEVLRGIAIVAVVVGLIALLVWQAV